MADLEVLADETVAYVLQSVSTEDISVQGAEQAELTKLSVMGS